MWLMQRFVGPGKVLEGDCSIYGSGVWGCVIHVGVPRRGGWLVLFFFCSLKSALW